MAATNLIENFQNLNIRDKTSETPPYATCLPFNPKSDFGISPSSLGQVDRYLFRLFDRYSDGYTDNKWVKSRDAVNTNFHFDKDVFATKDRSRAAGALRRHLQWDGRPEEEDNFVSWSSSLLLVLQYAFYRRAYYAYQGHKLEDIFLCIVDTTMLPDGVFLSDMPLIKAFSRYTDREAYKSLEHLKNLRQGSYYFGEYLSQGALQVEGCCAIVSMGDIVGDGLYELRGEFEAAALTSNKSWANAVLRLRETFRCSGSVSPPLTTHGEIEAALRIGNKFGPSLALPIGLAFLALKPRPAQDARIISASRSLSDRVREQLSPDITSIQASNKLPEVKQFDVLRKAVYGDYLWYTSLHTLKVAKHELQLALHLVKQLSLLDIEARPPIKTLPHSKPLRTVAQVAKDIEEELCEII